MIKVWTFNEEILWQDSGGIPLEDRRTDGTRKIKER
jgi:hypothetical protein